MLPACNLHMERPGTYATARVQMSGKGNHMSKSLMVNGQQMALTLGAGALSAKGTLIGVRHFIATKAGLTLPKVSKGNPGPTMKEVKAMALKAGKTEAELKLWSGEYDVARAEFYRQSGQITALLAQDPTYRKSVRVNVNSKGAVIGATTTFRKERTAAASVVAQLEARIAQLTAALTTATPVAALPVA